MIIIKTKTGDIFVNDKEMVNVTHNRELHTADIHDGKGMGSGTTAIACIKERRHFIGFELSKEYFDKAVRRIKAEQAQLTLF